MKKAAFLRLRPRDDFPLYYHCWGKRFFHSCKTKSIKLELNHYLVLEEQNVGTLRLSGEEGRRFCSSVIAPCPSLSQLTLLLFEVFQWMFGQETRAV